MAEAPTKRDTSSRLLLYPNIVVALAKLPPKQAAAIVLRHYHGYTNRAIGQALRHPRAHSRLAVDGRQGAPTRDVEGLLWSRSGYGLGRKSVGLGGCVGLTER
jgi:hypothetical protein